MPDAVVVKCPECEKRFKPKGDVQGKKIKCPFCKEPFVVPADMQIKDKPAKGKPSAAKAAKAKPEAETPSPVSAGTPPVKPGDEADFDDKEAYGVKHVEMVPRCPNCTNEMGPHDIICLSCGYNTLTREWGKTKKTLSVTFGQQLKYLGPALGAAAFTVFAIIFLIYYCVESPYVVYDIPILYLSDHESLRMWTTVIVLFWIYGAGLFCIKKFIAKPKPDEIEFD